MTANMSTYFLLERMCVRCFAFLLLVYSASAERGCAHATATQFNSPGVLRDLYGAQFDVHDTASGQGGVVVLGQHNCACLLYTSPSPRD